VASIAYLGGFDGLVLAVLELPADCLVATGAETAEDCVVPEADLVVPVHQFVSCFVLVALGLLCSGFSSSSGFHFS